MDPAEYATHEKTLVIRPEFLNHLGTVFGGFLMQWADDMAYNAASLTFPHAAFVTRRFESFDFKRPVRNGDIIKVFARVECLGTTSCQVAVWCRNAREGSGGGELFRTLAVMVNVDAEDRKQPVQAGRPA